MLTTAHSTCGLSVRAPCDESVLSLYTLTATSKSNLWSSHVCAWQFVSGPLPDKAHSSHLGPAKYLLDLSDRSLLRRTGHCSAIPGEAETNLSTVTLRNGSARSNEHVFRVVGPFGAVLWPKWCQCVSAHNIAHLSLPSELRPSGRSHSLLALVTHSVSPAGPRIDARTWARWQICLLCADGTGMAQRNHHKLAVRAGCALAAARIDPLVLSG